MQITKANDFELDKEMMEGSHKKNTKKRNLLVDTVFSWSLDNIFNEHLFKNKVSALTFTNKILSSCLYWKKVPSFCSNAIVLVALFLKNFSHGKK